MSNVSTIADNPDRLGDLAAVFVRRKIAMAVDGNGQLVLVRPDSVVLDLGETDDSLRRAIEAVAKVYPDQAGQVRESSQRRGRLVAVAVENKVTEMFGEQRWSVDPLQRAIDALRAAGGVVEPNHVLLGSQTVRGFPVGSEAHYAGGMMFNAEVRRSSIGPVLRTTSDPAPAPAWLPSRLDLGDSHQRPRVLVLDTGLRTVDGKGNAIEHPYLTSTNLHTPWKNSPVAGTIDDEDEYDDDVSDTLDFEAGHGTFIAGIVQQICPDAAVDVAGVLSSFGDGDVATVATAFETALTWGGEYDIVIMSLGGYMTDDDGSVLGAALRRLLGNGLGVSAAGNQSTSRPYFPAALPDIIGVGGLSENDKAWFTNFGGWVDACAPAIDVVSTFFMPSAEKMDEPPFTGWARWSGTSFAAPKVAAVIAQEMYLTGADARTAWRRLSDYRRYRFPDLGTVFNV